MKKEGQAATLYNVFQAKSKMLRILEELEMFVLKAAEDTGIKYGPVSHVYKEPGVATDGQLWKGRNKSLKSIDISEFTGKMLIMIAHDALRRAGRAIDETTGALAEIVAVHPISNSPEISITSQRRITDANVLIFLDEGKFQETRTVKMLTEFEYHSKSWKAFVIVRFVAKNRGMSLSSS